jgi:hypothetical protein
MKYLKHSWIFLAAAWIITILIKIPHLGLPYFWDETFSYIPAIKEMAKLGPGLLPGTISLFLSKGHPLFFYFVASSWMKFVAGDSIVLMRLFPLLVSLIALLAFHNFAKHHTNLQLANFSVLLLAVQPMFLAQASLVLPEIFLFTLFILSFDKFLLKQYGWYAFIGSLMILTKETAAVFLFIFGISFLVENHREWKTSIFWRNLIYMGLPAVGYLIFLLLHYAKFGVFFFSEHLDYISFDQARLVYKFNSAISTLLLAHGRNLIFFTAIAALIILVAKKRSIRYKRFLLLTLSILVVYLVFSILNFFTYRYIFPILGISLLALLALIQQISSRIQSINIAYAACIIMVSAFYSATKRGHSDADLGYTEYLVVQQQMTRYCEQQNWYDKEFGTGANLTMGMRDNFARYLTTSKNFKTHHLPGIENRDLIIYDSTCDPYEIPDEEKSKLTLIKRFEYKKHWGEIYLTPTGKIQAQVSETQPTKN